MTTAETIGIISGIFLITGYIPYIYEVIKKTTIPNRASWLIWTISTVTILFGLEETGTSEAIWVPVADAIGCSLIFLMAIFVGTGGWSKTDRFSFAISVISIALWWYTGNPLVGLFTNLLIYISGYIPTIAKSIRDPYHESLTAWSFFLIGVVLNLVTVIIGKDTGYLVWLYPIVLVATVGTLYFFLIRRFFTGKHA